MADLPTLTDFLLARLDEDEAVARGAYRDSVDDAGVCHEQWDASPTAVMWGDTRGVDGLEADYLSAHIARHDPAGVLAEVAAKRRIVERCKWVEAHPEWASDMEIGQFWNACADTLDDLASVYADHPDYDAGWAL